MERGTYHVADDPEEIYERLEPLATSRLVIDNEWIPDLEPELWDGDEVTADIGSAGRRLDELDLLPSPSRSRSTSPVAISAMSCACTRSAGSRTGICRPERTRPASG